MLEQIVVSEEIKSLRNLKEIFEDPNKKIYLEVIISFIKFNSSGLINDLEFFKIRNKPVAPYVATHLEVTNAMLLSGCSQPPLNNGVLGLINDYYLDLDYYIAIFKEAFKLSLDKFKKHIENHPAVPLFKAIRCFDPHCIQSNFNYHAFSTYFVIKEFNNYSDNLMNEWGIYCNLHENFDENFNLNNYWNEKINIFPTLSPIALKYVWLPVSAHSKVEAIIPIHTRCEKFPIRASECGLGYLPTVPTESVCGKWTELQKAIQNLLDLKKNLEKQENELKTKQVTLQKAKSSIIDSSNVNNSLTNGSKSPRSNKKLRN
ncbi:4167_t:CDS:2 [Entrophospora sp. SA101]|nr:4167_t:CDS:2 [Entrophospora sp. SA101]